MFAVPVESVVPLIVSLPIWERVRNLFSAYFSGADVKDVVWEKNPSVSCDPVALEKQALGCISKALAARYGEQPNRRSSIDLGTGWIDRVQNELHEKLNVFARHVRIKTGIELGIPSQRTDWYDVELDHYREFDRHRKQEIDKEIRELEESLK